MLRLRRLVTLIVFLWYALQGFMFLVVRPALAYSYGHWLHDFGNNLPALTLHLSLPVLGPEISTYSQSYTMQFWLVWGAIFLPPILFLRRIWTTTDRMMLLETTLYWGAIYLLFTLCLAVLVGLGLWQPFSVA